jgi:uncharacterized repeat protein (TIGR01451 family)
MIRKLTLPRTISASPLVRRVLIVTSAILALTAFWAPQAGAAVYRPLMFTDPPIPGCWPDPCTLREAVVWSEKNSTDDTIQLAAGTYTLDLPIAGVEDWNTPDPVLAGDLDITKNLTIEGKGPGLTVIDAQRIDRVFDIAPGAMLTLRKVTITGGSAQSSNVAGHEHGGGIHNHGTLVMEESALVGNEVVRPPKVLPNGALFPWGGGGLTNAGWAGLWNVSILENAVPALLGNQAYGGGIENLGSRLHLIHTTVAYNSATYGGGIAQRSTLAGSVHVRGTIVKWNVPGDCSGSNGMLSLGNNLFGSCVIPRAATLPSGAGPDLTGDPLFGPPLNLASGTPYLFPLQAGSPALDAGNNAVCPAVDQLGTVRPLDGDGNGTAVCDIGAFELPPVMKLDLANLRLSFKDVPLRARVGEELALRLLVTNDGPAAAQNAAVENLLPADVELVKAGETCEGTNTITCTLGELASGASAEVDIVVRPTAPGLLQTRAFVASSNPDPEDADNSATAEIDVEG